MSGTDRRNLLLVCLITASLFSSAHEPQDWRDHLKSFSSQLYIEENRGQFDESIHYQAFMQGRQVRFLKDGISVALVKESKRAKKIGYEWMNENESEYTGLVFTSRFLGTREECTPAGTGLLPGEIHYFKGNTAV
ncbi:MAG: hypothetical protein EAZ89_11285, partial [Bacteroidetes bacterium]